jgi:chromate transporter
MIYLKLFWEFFKTGLFALGGGLATIPFLYDMSENFGWFTRADLMNMIAVSESTPGAMGVNMATYVGYTASGGSFLGGITTTIGLVTPSVIVICIVAKFLQAFKESHWVQDVFYGLRPAVSAMIAVAGLGVLEATITYSGSFFESFALSNFNWIMVVLILIVLAISYIFKKLSPIVLIIGCAIAGILFGL